MSDGPPTAVRRLLFRIVQVFLVLAQPKLSILKPTEVLDALDKIAQISQMGKRRSSSTVPYPHLTSDSDTKISILFREIADEKTTEEDRKKKIKAVNSIVKRVIEFLTSR